jgi:hypothetical protein
VVVDELDSSRTQRHHRKIGKRDATWAKEIAASSRPWLKISMLGALGYSWHESNRSEYLAQYFLTALGVSAPVIRQVRHLDRCGFCRVVTPNAQDA